jgi:hypothetical protein
MNQGHGHRIFAQYLIAKAQVLHPSDKNGMSDLPAQKGTTGVTPIDQV